MNSSTPRKKYGTQKKCIKHLEKIRWGDSPVCPYCNNDEHISPRDVSKEYLPFFTLLNTVTSTMEGIRQDTAVRKRLKTRSRKINVWLTTSRNKKNKKR